MRCEDCKDVTMHKATAEQPPVAWECLACGSHEQTTDAMLNLPPIDPIRVQPEGYVTGLPKGSRVIGDLAKFAKGL